MLAGRIVKIDQTDTGLQVTYRERTSGEVKTLAVDKVVNCTGPDYDIDRLESRLMKQLRTEGLIVADPLRLGLQTDEDYNVMDRYGKVTAGLRYVGPMLRARYWEAIAVPELRVHAKQIAIEMFKRTA